MLKNKYYIILAGLLSFNVYAEPNENQLYPYPYNQQVNVVAQDQPYPYSPLPTQVYPGSEQPQDFYPYGQRSSQIYYGYNEAPRRYESRYYSGSSGCSCGR